MSQEVTEEKIPSARYLGTQGRLANLQVNIDDQARWKKTGQHLCVAVHSVNVPWPAANLDCNRPMGSVFPSTSDMTGTVFSSGFLTMPSFHKWKVGQSPLHLSEISPQFTPTVLTACGTGCRVSPSPACCRTRSTM